jgi:hypothetical protein
MQKEMVTVNPVAESAAREVSLSKERIEIEVDDLNNDGFPDLVLYVYSSNFLKYRDCCRNQFR